LNIKGAIEEYLLVKQNSLTQSTYAWYSQFLSLFADYCDAHRPRLTELAQVTAGHVQSFVAAAKTRNTHTRHARAQVVRGFLAWCSRDHETGVERLVVERIEMPRVVQSDVAVLTTNEVLRIFRACERTRQPHRNLALVNVLLDTGIRASELCYDSDRPREETGLRMDSLVLGRGDSFIRVMGKGLKSRTIGVGSATTLALRRYLNRERLGGTDGYVFLSAHGSNEPLSVRRLQETLGTLGDMAGIVDVHPHRFRHTFAVNQLLAGTSDLVLMRLMGHTTLESTRIYTRGMTQAQARGASVSIVDRLRR
jgi:site-specific recombinase XerD